MTDKYKLVNVAQSNGTVERTYTAYRIDHDSTDPLEQLLTVEVTDDDGTVREVVLEESDTGLNEYFTGSVRCPETDTVLVSDATTRDEVEAELGAVGVGYSTTDISPTPQEKKIIEREGALTGREVADALSDRGELMDRNLVSLSSQENLAQHIDSVSDAETKAALEELFEIITGKTVSEVLG